MYNNLLDMVKKVIVACAGAVATSTIVANKLRELIVENGIQAEILQCKLSELELNTHDADLVITTCKLQMSLEKPTIQGLSFITGIGVTELQADILTHLR